MKPIHIDILYMYLLKQKEEEKIRTMTYRTWWHV